MMKGKAVKVMTIGAFILGVTLPRVVAQDEPVYYLNGDAVVTGEDCYQLTPAINTQNGSVCASPGVYGSASLRDSVAPSTRDCPT